MSTDADNPLLALAKQAIPLVERATKALRVYQAKRLSAWWRRFTERQDDELDRGSDVEDQIFAAIADGDEKTVQAIMQGSRAAADSIDAVVLPAIARIGREYVRGNVPAWFQRNSLAYLSSLSAEEYGQLRDFLRSLIEGVGDRAAETVGVSMSASEPTVTIDQQPSVNFRLPRVLPNAMHVFGEFKRHGFGHTARAHQGSPGPTHVLMEVRVVRWLSDAIR